MNTRADRPGSTGGAAGPAPKPNRDQRPGKGHRSIGATFAISTGPLPGPGALGRLPGQQRTPGQARPQRSTITSRKRCEDIGHRVGKVPGMTAGDDRTADVVDASAPGLGPADLIFVFGSTLPDVVAPAAEAWRAGLAPLIVLTGGPNRRHPDHVESNVHARLLQAQGIPAEHLIVEHRSLTSAENVAFARPLIEDRLGPVRTVIAVVKWWQRRQLHLLAAGLPTIERIYAATWNPPARADGHPYDRDTWAATSDRPRIEAKPPTWPDSCTTANYHP